MLVCRAIIPHKLAVFIADTPFSITDAMATQYAIIAGEHEGLNLDTPSFLDFTRVRITDLSASEMLMFVRQRRALVDEPTTGPLSFVCGNNTIFGMLRMFSILAEVGGLWKENMVFVTKDPQKALDWIIERAGLDEAEAAQAAAELKDCPAWKVAESVSH